MALSIQETDINPRDLMQKEGHALLMVADHKPYYGANSLPSTVKNKAAGLLSGAALMAGKLPGMLAESALSLYPAARLAQDTQISRRSHDAVPRPANEPRPPLSPRDLEQALHTGVKRGEFFLEYQPIVRVTDGSIAGFESLVRWAHPTLGRIPPDRFIPLAEETQSISCITDFALEQACTTLAQLHQSDPGLRDIFVTVNISGIDLDRPDLVDHLCRTADRHGLLPRHLRLEITESALVPDSDISNANLECINGLGFGIAVDDFGAGYSNLGYLKRMPLRMLKIDRSLASDISTSKTSRSILRLVINLGLELDVDIVVEGLETAEDARCLAELGCQFAQGYHYFRPLPEAELIHLLAGNTIRQAAAG